MSWRSGSEVNVLCDKLRYVDAQTAFYAYLKRIIVQIADL